MGKYPQKILAKKMSLYGTIEKKTTCCTYKNVDNMCPIAIRPHTLEFREVIGLLGFEMSNTVFDFTGQRMIAFPKFSILPC